MDQSDAKEMKSAEEETSDGTEEAKTHESPTPVPLVPFAAPAAAVALSEAFSSAASSQPNTQEGPECGIFESLEGIDLPAYVRSHESTLTFPEKLMLMLVHMEREYAKQGKTMNDAPIAWALDGKAFVIRQREPLIEHWFPLFFRHSKFASFTRKLYRWGFRQVNMPRELIQQDYREMAFGNIYFQRDNKHLLKQMESVTAASTRRKQQAAAARVRQEEGTASSGAEEEEQKQPAVDPTRTQGPRPLFAVNTDSRHTAQPPAEALLGGVAGVEPAMVQELQRQLLLGARQTTTGAGGVTQPTGAHNNPQLHLLNTGTTPPPVDPQSLLLQSAFSNALLSANQQNAASFLLVGGAAVDSATTTARGEAGSITNMRTTNTAPPEEPTAPSSPPTSSRVLSDFAATLLASPGGAGGRTTTRTDVSASTATAATAAQELLMVAGGATTSTTTTQLQHQQPQPPAAPFVDAATLLRQLLAQQPSSSTQTTPPGAAIPPPLVATHQQQTAATAPTATTPLTTNEALLQLLQQQQQQGSYGSIPPAASRAINLLAGGAARNSAAGAATSGLSSAHVANIPQQQQLTPQQLAVLSQLHNSASSLLHPPRHLAPSLGRSLSHGGDSRLQGAGDISGGGVQIPDQDSVLSSNIRPAGNQQQDCLPPGARPSLTTSPGPAASAAAQTATPPQISQVTVNPSDNALSQSLHDILIRSHQQQQQEQQEPSSAHSLLSQRLLSMLHQQQRRQPQEPRQQQGQEEQHQQIQQRQAGSQQQSPAAAPSSSSPDPSPPHTPPL